MAVQDTKSSGAVHPLTRLSSQGEYVVVDRQAAQILRTASVRRIQQGQSRHGMFHELYFTTKRKAKCWLKRSRNQSRSDPVAVDPYDTSDWEDASDPKSKEDLRDATNVALEFKGILSAYYPGGDKYDVKKFRIVQLDHEEDDEDPSRDYFLKIDINAPRTEYIFVQVHAGKDEDGIPKLTLVSDYLRPRPLS